MSNWNEYAEKYNDITKILLSRFLEQNAERNVVFSPSSIITLLDILSTSTDGDTREEIMQFLGAADYEDVSSDIRELADIFSRGKFLFSANAICTAPYIYNNINDNYRKLVEEEFKAEVFGIDNMAQVVNEWVTEKTRGMINHVLDENDRDIIASFVNAISFSARWVEPYTEEKIWKEEFTNADGSKVSVEMLHSTEEEYVEDDYFTGVIKKYQGHKYDYMAFMPKDEKVRNLQSLIDKVNFPKLYRTAKWADVKTIMPEFKVQFGVDMGSICKSAG